MINYVSTTQDGSYYLVCQSDVLVFLDRQMNITLQKKYQFRTLLNISADFDKDEVVGVQYDGQSAVFILFEFSNGHFEEINRITNNNIVPFAGDNFYDDIQISLSQGCLNSFDDLFILYYNYAKFSNNVA